MRSLSHKTLAAATGAALALATGAVLGAGFDLAPEAERTDTLLAHAFDGSRLDLTNDGLVDLVVGNAGDPSRIYFGNGDGSFPQNAEFSAGFTTSDLDAGDLDGDGFIDLVQGNRGEVNQYFLGDGSGNFTAAAAIGDETDNTTSIELADMDNDGDLDVVVGNSSDQVNRVYPNATAGGVVAFGAPIDITADADYTRDLVVGDLNGDGDRDVVAANDDRGGNGNTGTAPTKVYLNTIVAGATTFAAGPPLPQSMESVDDLELGDLDNDGDLDLVKVSFSAVNRFFLNKLTESGTGTFSFDAGTDISADVAHSNAVGLVDIDGDGDLDVIVGNGDTSASPATGEANRLYLNQFVESGNTTVTFGAGQDISTDTLVTRDITSAELDGVNGPDIITGEREMPNRVYLNNGTATPFTNVAPAFTSIPVAEATVGMTYTYGITAEDADPDDTGDTLIITAPGRPAWLMGFTDNGNGTATLTGTPTTAEIGDHDVLLSVTDDDGLTADQNFTIAVSAAAPANTPPGFTSTPVTEAAVDEAYGYEVTATDADADPLSITSIAIPAWLTLTDNGDGTATLSGTPGATDAGMHDVSLQVSDGTDTAPQDFNVTVAEDGEPPADTTPPVITLIGPATVNITVGGAYNDQGATASDDMDGDLTDAIVTDSNVNTSSAGSYTVIYDVADAAGNDAATVTRTVNVNQPPGDNGGGGGAIGFWWFAVLSGMFCAAGRRQRA